MAAIETYRACIQKLLIDHSQIGGGDPNVEMQVIFDVERDHYQLVQVGWLNDRRIYGCILHLDIKDGKIWIQHNGTEFNVADELISLCVLKQDIVLGFHSPSKRRFSEFAVG
jgi:hypothetical protein